jgi:hypothetical protein
MTNCVTVTEFPYTEGFEGDDLGCWTEETVIGNNPWHITSSYSSSGMHSAMILYYTSTESRLMSPTFDLTGLTSPTLTFNYNLVPYSYSGIADTLALYYRTSESSEWVRIKGYNTGTTGFEIDTVTLPNPSATYQIAFMGYGINGDNVYVDDIAIFGESGDTTIVVTDPTVATQAASAISQTTATLNATVTNPDGATLTGMGFSWMPLMGDNYTTIAGTATTTGFSATLTNLDPSTDYIFSAYIVYNGDTITGNELIFTTLDQGVDPCAVPTGLHATDIENHAITIAWDDNANVDNWNIQYRVVGSSTLSSATSSTNTYTITNLNGDTDYEIQVQADCGNGNFSDWSDFITVHTDNVGIENWLENSITLFPNPARDYVDLRVDGDLNVTAMEVYDVYGKLINTVGTAAAMQQPYRINVNGLANGMYFVRVSTEAGVVTKTFVKK